MGRMPRLAVILVLIWDGARRGGSSHVSAAQYDRTLQHGFDESMLLRFSCR